MRDYRYTYPYTEKEWEDDIDWLAERLAFIWNFREHYPREYMLNDLSVEKNIFYEINNGTISKLAHEKYNTVDFKFFDKKYENFTLHETAIQFNKLLKIKKRSVNEFFKKCNMNEYDYITCRYDISELFETLNDYS